MHVDGGIIIAAVGLVCATFPCSIPYWGVIGTDPVGPHSYDKLQFNQICNHIV